MIICSVFTPEFAAHASQPTFSGRQQPQTGYFWHQYSDPAAVKLSISFSSPRLFCIDSILNIQSQACILFLYLMVLKNSIGLYKFNSYDFCYPENIFQDRLYDSVFIHHSTKGFSRIRFSYNKTWKFISSSLEMFLFRLMVQREKKRGALTRIKGKFLRTVVFTFPS